MMQWYGEALLELHVPLASSNQILLQPSWAPGDSELVTISYVASVDRSV